MTRIKTIVFMDDHELHADEDTHFIYNQGSHFVENYYQGSLVELINVLVIRSMDTFPTSPTTTPPATIPSTPPITSPSPLIPPATPSTIPPSSPLTSPPPPSPPIPSTTPSTTPPSPPTIPSASSPAPLHRPTKCKFCQRLLEECKCVKHNISNS